VYPEIYYVTINLHQKKHKNEGHIPFSGLKAQLNSAQWQRLGSMIEWKLPRALKGQFHYPPNKRISALWQKYTDYPVPRAESPT
jgi:hypothetical protein